MDAKQIGTIICTMFSSRGKELSKIEPILNTEQIRNVSQGLHSLDLFSIAKCCPKTDVARHTTSMF